MKRLEIKVFGNVQGVGFRPFVYRLAKKYQLTGTVQNNGDGVCIEVEGSPVQLEAFKQSLKSECVPPAEIHRLSETEMPTAGRSQFSIESSSKAHHISQFAPADIATCTECILELFDKNNRRFYYPFTNCSQCGPRTTIIQKLPYDRAHTTMQPFSMCKECEQEYLSTEDRRFHAQPNACPACGPRLHCLDARRKLVAENEDAFHLTLSMLRQGTIVALKGLGGYQLIVDTQNEKAVQMLRARKHRPQKPLAIMVPDFESAASICTISPLEKSLLESPAAPIVLLPLISPKPLWAEWIAPKLKRLGIFLPYTPLHHLLLRTFGKPLVVTSGNREGEPIEYQDESALRNLSAIADIFLIHNREIHYAVDDSIVQVVAGRPMNLRRARGYSTFLESLDSKNERQRNIFALGGFYKNTFSFIAHGNVHLGPHLGNLASPRALSAFETSVQKTEALYQVTFDEFCGDAHPHTPTTSVAEKRSRISMPIQHHHAHVAAVMAEYKIDGPLLGLAWDGTGFGNDGSIWGSEAFIVQGDRFTRVSHLLPFQLLGGDKASLEPRRIAFALLNESLGISEFIQLKQKLPCLQTFSDSEFCLLTDMSEKKINAPLSSSMGRLFDGVSSILNLTQINEYEGHAASLLECACKEALITEDPFPFAWIADGACENSVYNDNSTAPIHGESKSVADWRPMIRCLLNEFLNGTSPSILSARFHNTLVQMVVQVVRRFNLSQLVLSGGCFQNKLLTENIIHHLQIVTPEVSIFVPSKVPPNDGGISLGQLAILAATRSASNRLEKILL